MITEISKKRKDVSYLLVGDGEKRDSLVGYLRESHHLDRVVFSGHVDHDLVPHYISAMDIALAPFPKMDFWYASPMKVLEYMACCRPVVATNQGQVREIIEDGKNGFLCAPGNYREMLARVERLIDNADLRRELGENARKTVCKEYTWKNSGKKILKVMETVLKRHAN